MGTYNKTVWSNGDLITHEKLNKIEEQLELVTPGATSSIRHDKNLNLSTEQQGIARFNIAAASTNDVTSLENSITAANAALDVLSGRMDTFTALGEGSTTGDAELADIRVGDDGTTYNTAGEALRAQLHEVKADMAADNERIDSLEALAAEAKGLLYLGENANLYFEQGANGALLVHFIGRMNFRYKNDFATPKEWDAISASIQSNITIDENTYDATIRIPQYSALVYDTVNRTLQIRRYHNASTFQFVKTDSVLLANAYRKPVYGLLLNRWLLERADDAANANGLVSLSLNEWAQPAFETMVNAPKHADNFLYFTDYLREPISSWNTRVSSDMARARKYENLLPLDFTFFGGGWNTNGLTNSAALENVRIASTTLKSYFKDIYVGIGARDLNTTGVSDEENAIDGGDIAPLAIARINRQKSYYSFNTDNITYIVLNTGKLDTVVANESEYEYEINTYLPQAIAAANGKPIVIFANMMYSDVTVGENEFSGILSPVGEAIVDKINSINNNNVIAIFTGYTLQDFVTEVNNIKIIGTANFVDEVESIYAMDAVTIDLDANKIICNRIGSIGESREILL